MAEQPHNAKQTGSGPKYAQQCVYSLEVIMELQKALENGMPSQSLDTDIAGGPVDGATRRESRPDEANLKDDSSALEFLCLWIQRQVHCAREALLLAVAKFGTSAEWAEWYDHTQVAADNEAGSRAPVLRSTTD